jgi:uncharacterized membrane protein HdeD (DUF308 family)
VEVIDDGAAASAKWWWVFLVTGIAWIIAAFVILGFDATSAALIAIIVGVMLIAAGVNELVDLALRPGWKWLHAVLGVLFIGAGVFAFFEPFQIFGVLAVLIGWYLVIKGTFGIIVSIMERDVLPLWGLLLAAGIIEVVIGIWAIGYPGRSAALLIIWAGIGAMLRGLTEIILAFTLRSGGGAPTAYA